MCSFGKHGWRSLIHHSHHSEDCSGTAQAKLQKKQWLHQPVCFGWGWHIQAKMIASPLIPVNFMHTYCIHIMIILYSIHSQIWVWCSVHPACMDCLFFWNVWEVIRAIYAIVHVRSGCQSSNNYMQFQCVSGVGQGFFDFSFFFGQIILSDFSKSKSGSQVSLVGKNFKGC